MVKKTEQQKLREAINELTSRVEALSQHQEEMDKKILQAEQESGKQRRRLQQSNLSLAQVNSSNTLQVVALARNLVRFHQLIAGATQRNIDLTRALAQNALTQKSAATNFSQAADTGRISFSQAIETFGQMTEMGMGGFSNATLRLATDLKNLGTDMRGVLEGIRFQTQMLGVQEETSRLFMDTLVSTAALQRTSISELVGTLNSFKDEFTKISVQFGPQMALFAQRAAQGLIGTQTELFEPTLRLITDLMVGTEGMIKAGRLAGQPFRPGMDESQFRSTLQSALAGLRRVDPGAVGGPRIEAITAGFGITQESLQVSRMISGDIAELTTATVADLSKSVTERAATQMWQAQLFTLQASTNDVLQHIAGILNFMGGTLATLIIGGSFVKSLVGAMNLTMVPLLRVIAASTKKFALMRGAVSMTQGMTAMAGAAFLPGLLIPALIGGFMLGIPKIIKAFSSSPAGAAGDDFRQQQLELAKGTLDANKEIADSTKKIADRGRDQSPGATGNLSRLLTTLINNSERQAALLEDGNTQRDIFNDFLGSAPAAANGSLGKPSGG